MNYEKIISSVYQQLSEQNNYGNVAAYIPELAKVNGAKFGVFLQPVNEIGFGVGDYNEKFSIQSIAKVPLLALAFQLLGDNIWTRIGYEPSGTSFNSIVQLELERGIPRNPLINAGAMVLCDILIDCLNNPLDDFLDFIREIAANKTIAYNEKIAKSEEKTGYKNYAIISLMKSFGNIHNDIDKVLNFYFHICSIEMTCRELASTFLFMANKGIVPDTKTQILNSSQTKRINAIMQTCGFYDEAGEFAFKVGLPGKSGVGGGIVAIYPSKYAVAVWSPRLNSKGNSYKGLLFLEELTTKTAASIF